MSPSPIVLAVAKRRKAGCGWMTRFWSSSVSRPETSRTRWMTNITSGRPASYSSKTSAVLVCSAQGRMPSWKRVICWAVLKDDRVLADEVDAGDVAVEIDPHAGPVETGRDLLDMGRLAGAVIALDHHAPVVREAGQDGERRVAVEEVVLVDRRHVLGGGRVGGHLDVDVEAEGLAGLHLGVRQAGAASAVSSRRSSSAATCMRNPLSGLRAAPGLRCRIGSTRRGEPLPACR